jgi:hypothetical protein
VELLVPSCWEAVQHKLGIAGRSLGQTLGNLVTEPPVMPALGHIIKQIESFEDEAEFLVASSVDSTPDTSKPPPPPPPMLINFDRVRRIGTVINVVRTSQMVIRLEMSKQQKYRLGLITDGSFNHTQPAQVPYPFIDLSDPLLSLLMSSPQFGDEESAYEQSKKVEAALKKKKQGF